MISQYENYLSDKTAVASCHLSSIQINVLHSRYRLHFVVADRQRFA